MKTEPLLELSKDYIRWVIVGINGGGYTAECKRLEIHEKIEEILGEDKRTEINNVLWYLDKQIGFPLNDVEGIDGKRMLAIINKFGGKLFKKLKEKVEVV